MPPLLRSLRTRLRRSAPVRRADPPPSTEDALVRALCHDMRGSLSCLESALHHLDRTTPGRDEVLVLAQAQAAHLTSLLRTAEATGGAPPRRADRGRMIPEVVAASVAASGLPRGQLTVQLDATAGGVEVGDARLQRILVNLLENAHRHGNGAPVQLGITSGGGWVEFAVTQAGIPVQRIVEHLRTTRPPADLTGLGLWSVQQQARELGGWVVWDDVDDALTLRVQLPDH
ncbi:sensor histidine kinase [Blastococcus haudaquaticus]|uniref:Histidine kinase-, DNA gyrase B-, and HSP90-like ATPase n=1 Tax=Blastococcus haudaquaticus TaxID=1938745 RepID=A0A286GX47_9ACTN|nr:HAMP domain-containing sensor histidine kinase [Blastococcus haudaquaticus]SOE00071.1 Histidine kinase-, DNA gyrase B-, and HSP90-like ATPase [Blastococcus haudaquaticus]